MRTRIFVYIVQNLYIFFFLYAGEGGIAVARGELDKAERIAAEDRLVIISADESTLNGQNTDAEVTVAAKPKKQKRDADDPILGEMQKVC